MKCIILCLFGIAKTDASLKWSASYSYEAVLTVPGSEILEPYKVWVDGATGNTRADFYNGLDKLFRIRLFGAAQRFVYYKIYPESTLQTLNQRVCRRLQLDEFHNYATNTYLPIQQNFIYQGIDQISGSETEKWQASKIQLMDGYNITSTYTIWVTYNKDNMTIPKRYEYRVSAGQNILDNFSHDYVMFSIAEVDKSIFDLPDANGLSCSVTELKEYEPYDPLLEYIEPAYEHVRITKDFERFKQHHNKTYSDARENSLRLKNFRQNLRFINSQNRKHKSFSLAVNHLADASDDEMAGYLRTYDHSDDNSVKYDGADINDNKTIESEYLNHFDWRDYGAVSPVKDQTSLCGSCYAFTTAATVESSIFIQNGFKKMLEVSEQAIIDCSWRINSRGNYGCDGGNIENSLKWIKIRGIPYRDEYGRYLAEEGLCYASNVTKLAHISRYIRVKREEKTIKRNLRKLGPLAVAISDNPKTFMFYFNGIYNDENCRWKNENSLGHALTLIGYGEQNGERFWTLKNSYGPKWGEAGYIRIAIDNNICDVMSNAYSVIVSS